MCTPQGARRLYSDFIRPLLMKYQAQIDQHLQHLHDIVVRHVSVVFATCLWTTTVGICVQLSLLHVFRAQRRLGVDATATRVRDAVRELPVLSYLARGPDEE